MTRLARFASLASASLVALLALGFANLAAAQQPAICLSPSPNDWPQPSKPYFLIIADTSLSMTTPVGSPAIESGCGYGTDRRAHLRCTLRNLVRSYSGVANFGLMTYARNQTNCSATCFTTCMYANYPGNSGGNGCGASTGVNRRGGFIRVPMLQDSFWTTPPPADNSNALLGWVDNACSGNTELFADGETPLNGALRDAARYFSTSGWTAQDNSVTYPTPLAPEDLAGIGINGGTGCRSANVILITDGDETCDAQADAVGAAQNLYQNGVSVGGKTFKVPVHVINFSGATVTFADQIAAAGGTVVSVLADDATELSMALSSIVNGRLRRESCDNVDNDCNACIDEGFRHFAHTGQTCCAWATPAQRNTCLTGYFASISPANPLGTTSLLPCTTIAQGSDQNLWLCQNPGEICDNLDNNGNGQIDEGMVKCGSPLACPTTEVCNGRDDDCDGQVDEGTTCSGASTGPEICDGCDNDFNGFADDNVSPLPCGQPSPASCAGQLTCRQPPAGVAPGGCVAGGGVYNACSNSPVAETCDGMDNNCNGLVDDGIALAVCTAPGAPAGLVFGGSSQCVQGRRACGGPCIGYVGPTAEVSDSIDNDCDGIVDNLSLFKDSFEP